MVYKTRVSCNISGYAVCTGVSCNILYRLYLLGMVSYSRVCKYGFVMQQYAVYSGIPGFGAAYQRIPRYSKGYVAL